MTVEDYIEAEWASELRHEYINGELFEMAGEKDINNEMAAELFVLLRNIL